MNSQRQVWKEPMGVVGAIVPWNFPFEVTINKLGQILATGNTIVLKPAPDTPWNATRLGRLVAEKTDIPAGVVNVVTSSDHLVGEELTLVAAGRHDLLHRLDRDRQADHGEGRGHDEAGLPRARWQVGDDRAATTPTSRRRCPAARWCACTPVRAAPCRRRMLLPRSRYDEGVELITQAMSMVPYGDPTDPNVMMGPLVSAKQRDRVLGYIAKGQEEGAKLVLGGGRPAQFPKGYFVEPTLFVDVDNSMTIAQEEIFGPVLAVIPYEDDDDAVRIANDSGYGLSGGVFSGNEARATADRAAHPHRVDQRQRRDVVRGRLALRRLQGQRYRPPERSRGIRAVPRDEGHRLAAALTATHLR